MIFRFLAKLGRMSLLVFLRRIGFAAAALAVLALSAAGVVAPRVAAAAPAPVAHAESAYHGHAHAHADAHHVDSGAARHVDHASGGACGDVCCGPVGCALPVPPIAVRLIAVTEVSSAWLPVERLMDLGLAYSIERPPRG